MKPRALVTAVIAAAIVIAIFAYIWLNSPPPAHAQEVEYTVADTLGAIDQASDEVGVSRAWLYRTVECETGGTFDPYARGDLGELGAAQLKPDGELPRFYKWGYLDPFSPWQAVRFMAQRFRAGGSGAWSCA